MSDTGFVKLYRKMLDNPVVCKDADHIAVWIYILLSATWQPYEIMFEGKKTTLEPGQLVTGRQAIGVHIKINEYKVQRILKLFESEQLIAQQTTPRNRLISVLNWNQYQSNAQQNTQQLHNNCTTSAQQSAHKQEEYKKKEEEYKEDKHLSDLDVFFEKAWKLYPRKEGKGSVSKTQKKKLYDLGDEFIRCIERYIQKRNGKDPKYTQMGSTFFNSGYVDYLDINYGQPIFQQPTIEVNSGPQVPNYRSED